MVSCLSTLLIQRIKAMLLCIEYSILFVYTVDTKIKAHNAMFVETVDTRFIRDSKCMSTWSWSCLSNSTASIPDDYKIYEINPQSCQSSIRKVLLKTERNRYITHVDTVDTRLIWVENLQYQMKGIHPNMSTLLKQVHCKCTIEDRERCRHCRYKVEYLQYQMQVDTVDTRCDTSLVIIVFTVYVDTVDTYIQTTM